MRFLVRFGGVVLNGRALVVLFIWDLEVRYCLARLRYVEDSDFILSELLCAVVSEFRLYILGGAGTLYCRADSVMRSRVRAGRWSKPSFSPIYQL